MLFPFIKEIALAKKNATPLPQSPFGTIQNPINMMEAEHDDAGDIIKQIAELSNNYTPPAEACNTYRALYAKLEEYQNDFVYLSEVNAYINNLSLVVPDDKKPVLSEIHKKLSDIQRKFEHN
jgi:iron-sulfur cluster repair protein YtfE (RIC family)